MSDDAEGSETPSAPGTPEQEATAAAEHADDAGAESRRPRLLPVWILLGAAAVAGGAWAVTERGGGGEPPPDEAGVPLITASAEPFKIKPDDPGGMEIPNRGTLIYETLTTADPEEGPERVLPPPEEPLSPPQPEEPVAEEPAASAPEAETVAALKPGVAPESAPEPEAAGSAPVEPGAPEPATTADTPSAETGTQVISLDGIPLPPTKPGRAAPAPVEETPWLEPDALELAVARGTPPPEPDAPATPPVADDGSGVPVPVFKPVGAARAEPSGEVAAPVPEAEPEPEPEQAGSRDWRYVQLAASDARRPLEAHWESLRRNHNDVLVGLSPLIMPVDSGESGITYRLRAGPLNDEESARWVCAQLTARGLDCFVPRD